MFCAATPAGDRHCPRLILRASVSQAVAAKPKTMPSLGLTSVVCLRLGFQGVDDAFHKESSVGDVDLRRLPSLGETQF
jgi:hypothetical protein